jgi:peptide-methionine (S)-S-oxide reductase
MPRTLPATLLAIFLFHATPALSATAVFAGGCFWCMESAYQEVDGVTEVVSGFSGGSHPNPTYKGAHTGHYEAVLVTYDPAAITYGELVDIYWRNIDPFDGGGQFCDRGESYRAALFVDGEAERALAEASRQVVVERFPAQKVVTEILDRAKFFPVEESHQDYYLKNPLRYKYYRYSCGRDKRLETIWGAAP